MTLINTTKGIVLFLAVAGMAMSAAARPGSLCRSDSHCYSNEICNYDLHLVRGVGLCEIVEGCNSHPQRCDDGLFCNGQEVCFNDVCRAGTPPCGDMTCIEDGKRCVDIRPPCTVDADCEPGGFCNDFGICEPYGCKLPPDVNQEGETCGTIAGCACASGLFCDADPNIPDAAGICRGGCTPAPQVLNESSVKWQSIGSAGAVDESSLENFEFWGTQARVSDGVSATVDFRYNIDCEIYDHEDLSYGLSDLEVRYRDDGDAARVRLYLKRISFETGDVETLHDGAWTSPSHSSNTTFDSDDWCPSDSVQTFGDSLGLGDYLKLERCNEYSYYFEAKVTQSGDGNPALTILRLKGY